jgi:WD40 repeat protein
VAVSPDGKLVLTGSADATARLWSLDYQSLMDDTCAHIFRDLTPNERSTYEISDPTACLASLATPLAAGTQAAK